MSTPTEKPVDRVSVSLSDADFKRIVGNSMLEVLHTEFLGRVEVLDITTMLDDEREGWVIDCLFIPANV